MRTLGFDRLESRRLLSSTAGQPLVIDDAVFAHDFEQISGQTVTALRGPNATVNSSYIVPSTVAPTNLSTQHITPTFLGNGRGEYVNTNNRLTGTTKELSYTIFYNARGDNGGDWVNSTSSAILLAATDYSQPGRDFWFATTKYQGGGVYGADRHLWFGYLDSTVPGAQWKVVISTQKIPDQDTAWHQAGFVYQGGPTDGTVTFYFDGQHLGVPVTIAGVPEIGALVAPWTLIEDYNPYQSASGDEYFDNGFYDEAALWTRAISADEMLALYRSGFAAENNIPPTANPDAYAVDEDNTLNVLPAGVLANDTDPGADTLTARLVGGSGPSHGTLDLRLDGSFTYAPDANWHGTESFQYQAFDGYDYSEPATVTITVNSVIDAVIDVKPGSDVNPINLGSNGVLPIAILSTQVSAGEIDDFDATKVDVTTIKLNGVATDPVHVAFEDIDGDGDLDLVLHFRMEEIRSSGALDEKSVDLLLSADFDGGDALGPDLAGSDAVKIVPPAGKGKCGR